MFTNINLTQLHYSVPALRLFLLITLGGVFAVGALIVAAGVEINSPLYYALYAVGLATPFAGAMAYFWKSTGSIRNLFSMMRSLEMGSGALMIPAIPVASIFGYYLSAGLGLPVQWQLLPPFSSLVIAFIGWTSVIWLEEVAWRGTLLPVLQLKFSALSATVLVNLVWVIWHLPLLYILEMNLVQLGLFSLQTFGLSLVMTWAGNRSRTVWIAVMIHGAFNAVSTWMLTTVPTLTPNTLIGVQAIGPAALGLLILLLTRGRLGQRSGEAIGSAAVPAVESVQQ